MIIQTSILSQVQPRAFSEIRRTYDNKSLPAKEEAKATNADGDVWESTSGKILSTLTPEEQQQVQQLRQRDQEVRNHEQAHVRAGGSLVEGPFFEYESGPDGKLYAVDGEVIIDASTVPDEPQETVSKMQRVQVAALAPAVPSPQDRRVAAEAARKEAVARAELRASEYSAYEVEKADHPTAESKKERSAYSELTETLSPLTTDFLEIASFSRYQFSRKPGPGLYIRS